MTRHLLPIAALAACIAAVHAPAVVGGHHLTAHHDNLDGAAPLRIEAARQWTSGHVPLWNPYKRAGMPLAADTTAGALYPGNLPFLWAAGAGTGATDSPVFLTMDLVAALHALLAAGFFYVFAAAIGAAPWACVLGALLFACSGTMGWFAAWYIQIQNSAVWLPLVLAAAHSASTGMQRRRQWIAIGGLAVAMQWFAGFPELSVYTGLIAVAYAASLSLRARGIGPLAAVAAIYVAGISLAAVQLVPALELLSMSRRPGALPLEVFQSLAASPSMVLGWIAPSLTPVMEFPPAAAYHFGAVAVAAAAVGLFARTHAARFFAVLLAIGFVLSIGSATPVSGWIWHVPGVAAFRHPFKHLFELSFAMAVLAAIGASKLDDLARGARWPRAVVVAGILATTVSLAVNQSALVSGNPANVDVSGRRPAVAGDVAHGERLLALRHVFLRRDPSFLIGDYATQFEVPSVHGAGPYLWTNLAAATGLVEEEVTFRRGLFGREDRTLALLSCGYAMQTKQGNNFWPAVDPEAYRVVADLGDAKLVHRDDAFPRHRFVGAAECADAGAIAASLEHGTPDPLRTALLTCADEADAIPALATVVPAPPVIDAERPGHVSLDTDVAGRAPAFLVISQADFPGWKATTDGAAARIRRVHNLVQGIVVPGGTKRVELDYLPGSFVAGAAISAVALVMLVAAVIAERRRESVMRAAPGR